MARLKSYDEDIKKQAVKYNQEETKPIAQGARELKISGKLYMVG